MSTTTLWRSLAALLLTLGSAAAAGSSAECPGPPSPPILSCLWIPSPLGAQNPPGKFEEVEAEILGAKFGRNFSPYTLWKLQRVQDRYRAIPADRRPEADALLERMRWAELCQRPQGPRLEKSGFQLRLAG